MWNKAAAFVLSALLVASCRQSANDSPFPTPERDISPITGPAFSTEDVRDRMGEFTQVVGLADVKPGMWVADVGSGEGYYAVRLAPVVGNHGRVLAEDIQPEVTTELAQRIDREHLDNVAVSLGTPDDPKLPANSFDRIFLVHVYHEVESPYAFLWHLREGLKPGGRVDVVELDRPPRRHGVPPGTLICEFAALGLKQLRVVTMTDEDAYFAEFEVSGPRPAPAEIKPCGS
jgi:predicted methyltransferase